MSKIDAILVAGATASGKSAFAMDLAKKHDSVIVNADSMQVYKELRVLSARPSEKDEDEVPHALYGTVSGADGYSVGQWYQEAEEVIKDCKSMGRTPIFTGGTGLYFTALLDGISKIPPIPKDIREHWRQQAEEFGAEHLHKILSEKDPVMAERLPKGDTQRITRSLEVIEATGTSLSEWQKEAGAPLVDITKTEKFVISMDREVLYKRCDRRFDLMLIHGALQEVENLLKLDLDPNLPIMGALGVDPLKRYIEGTTSIDDAIEETKRDTRRYAKRQMTWLRGNMITWKWFKK